MYIYNYLHIWRAARNVKNPPANNYAVRRSVPHATAHGACGASRRNGTWCADHKACSCVQQLMWHGEQARR